MDGHARDHHYPHPVPAVRRVSRCEEEPRLSRQHPAYLEWLPALHVTLQLAILTSLFMLAATDGPVWTTWVAAVSCGFSAGISVIVPAHEARPLCA
ncbi:TPA: hypothetical protein EYM82_25285 [Candidatus Poribacteria bacterium]|nr:hypothetical protein [Candidatus Poribacteria bacterium]